ncbi:MAG: PKD domain-containing protein [Bacteroidota bacterium]
MKINTLIVMLSIVLAISCNKKKLPAEASQEPVFYLKGELDGNPINLEAGNSNYVMHAFNAWDTTGVCLFKSELKKQNCDSSCNAYALTLIINDYTVTTPNSNIKLDNALRIGEYNFNDKDLPSMYYKVNLIPKIVKSSSELYTWTIENGHDGPTVVNKYCPWVTMTAGQNYSVTLNFDNNNGCSSSHQNIYSVGHFLQTNVIANRNYSIPGAIYDFSCQSSGTAPYQYLWDFGDGSTSTLQNPNHSYQVILNGRSRVKLRVVDAKYDTCISYYQVQISADPSCDANFTTTFTPVPNNKAFGTLTILLSDQNGHVYSSKLLAQPESSKFEILAISDYLMNSDNHPTKKIKAKLNCVLSDGQNQIVLSNAEITMALAYTP